MTRFEKSYHIFQSIKSIGIVICGISIFAMMFFIVADVFSRNFFTGSLNGSIEFVQYYLMPLAIIPGLAYVYATGVLPRMEVLLDKFKGKLKAIIANSLLLFEFLLFSLVIYYSFKFAISGVASASSFTAGGVIYPYYHVLFLIPVMFILVNLEIIFILIRNFQMKRALFKFYSDEDEGTNNL
ncbi:TRAP transporter small permease subunit [Desertibacillus haloalkaliphilus]|uniref:TRAP transporter small permease subunit n=1 Tax=Desertibacillus haloalkaliphilus TaxID=1328930 RepID=UPI001C27C488|nr:TRAP transporter small permease subunit [Desertibacillus haloalkaliphilus]MBU8906120.1 TRAP transporter small permease subunit [Desertibacillus haloalkaliphilus]